MMSKIKGKKTKAGLWYLDKLLMLFVAAFVIAGIVIIIVSTGNDDVVMIGVGVAMLPGAGILMTPNIIMNAIKDSRGWRDIMLDSKLLSEAFFIKVSDPLPCHKKICAAVIREAVLNFLALLAVIGVVIAASIVTLEDNSDDRALFFLLLLIATIIFAVPIIAYNVTCAAYRIRIALKREYCVYRSEVKAVDGYNMKIVGKRGIYKFKYCKCIGIRKSDVYEAKAVLVFVPNEVFLLPDNAEVM